MKTGSWANRNCKAAFSRTDAVACLAALFLLILIAVPLLGNTAGRNDRMVCINNLRQIGRAFLEWGHDHGDVFAWMRPMPQGTRGHPLHGNLWFQFFTLSNELRTPRILSEPADSPPWAPTAVTATSFHDGPGWFLSAAYRNNAVRYFLGEHASPAHPREVLSGDLNIRTSGTAPTSVGWHVSIVDQSRAAWTDNLHGLTGNLLFSDGHVEQTDTTRLRSAVGWNNHFLFPYNPDP